MATHVPKLKLNTAQAMASHQKAATAAAKDRFAIAEEITKVKPHGLAPVASQSEAFQPVAPNIVTAQPFDLSACQPGSIVQVPLHLIDVNPLSPRHFYKNEEVDKIAASLPNGQDDAAHGYIEGGRVKLIDGGTRFRAAKITDRVYLDVKIEVPPKDKLDLFNRARALNDLRSDPTSLDFALSLRALLDQGAVTTQRELIEKVAAPGGGKLSETMVSTYLRIARMPEPIQRMMGDAPETSTVVALYAVSELFDDTLPEAEQEKRLELAKDIIDEIKRKKLNRHQVAALVKSKLDGPKSRERSVVHPLEFGASKGQIKMFGRKGQIDLTLKGLDEARMPGLRAALVKSLEEYLGTTKAQD